VQFLKARTPVVIHDILYHSMHISQLSAVLIAQLYRSISSVLPCCILGKPAEGIQGCEEVEPAHLKPLTKGSDHPVCAHS